MQIQTPNWVRDAVFYQIFPDRFARSSRTRHPRGINLKEWGSPPEEQGFQGGDLYGIVDRLGYLQALGITAIYLNPIFASAANHRYHAFDYYQVDPLLGGNNALRELLDQAHARDIRVVLDGVFNHASRGFWPFHHILENGPNSPYVDWFQILDWPLHPYHSSKERPLNYKGWWGHAALPEFNTDNPGARDYLFEVAKYWIDFGIDGWRLDVPGDIDDDSFWQEFRRIVKTANPDAYLCGEIWHEAQRWLQGDQFDSVMNYLFAWNALNFFGADTLRTDWAHPEVKLRPIDAASLAQGINHMHSLYDWEINHVQLNLLDSHDMPRALQLLGEDKRALRLAVLFQMTMPGAPCIYYGDEVGLSAGGDPFCRGAFPWQDESSWDHDLLAFYQAATALRHGYAVLRTGSFEFIHCEDKVIAFQRQLEDQGAIVVMNAGKTAVELKIPVPDLASKSLEQVWPTQGQKLGQTDGTVLSLNLPPQEAAVLLTKN